MPDGQVKLGAGRMIESLGWKRRTLGDASVYANHALVLVNHGHATSGEVRQLINSITEAVAAEYGLTLEPEPRLIR